MWNNKRLRPLTIALTISLTVSLALVGHSLWRNWLWRVEVYVLAAYVGTDRAIDDFNNGKRRLFEIDGEREDDTFTGRTEGPFEIWNPQYLPLLGYPHIYSTEQMVASYNLRMRNMTLHPERFGLEGVDSANQEVLDTHQ